LNDAPLGLSDDQLGLLFAAAALIDQDERAAFLCAFADQLEDPVTDKGVQDALRYVLTTDRALMRDLFRQRQALAS